MVVQSSSGVSGVNCGDEATVIDWYSCLVPINVGYKSGSDLNRFVKIIAESGEEDSKQMTDMMKKLMVRDDSPVDKLAHSSMNCG
ncbi:hypothetical protein V7S43_004037 [Phytophthora oleae]|uniref:Uncharacterized protein n=1 Tax=Phytophthora oleae TaxID=2107226 RepID=A0ABD3FY06_9STRA